MGISTQLVQLFHSIQPGKKHANADVLSRLPLLKVPTGEPLPDDTVLLMECLQVATVTVLQIRTWTDRDPILSKFLYLVLRAWPKLVSGDTADLLPYTRRSFELGVQMGVSCGEDEL